MPERESNGSMIGPQINMNIMVLILDGNSDHVAHLLRKKRSSPRKTDL